MNFTVFAQSEAAATNFSSYSRGRAQFESRYYSRAAFINDLRIKMSHCWLLAISYHIAVC